MVIDYREAFDEWLKRVGGPPGVAGDLLAGDVGRDLRLQVNVDYVQSVAAGQVELHVQDGPLDTYRDDAVH
jgi:hypothetical protein